MLRYFYIWFYLYKCVKRVDAFHGGEQIYAFSQSSKLIIVIFLACTVSFLGVCFAYARKIREYKKNRQKGNENRKKREMLTKWNTLCLRDAMLMISQALLKFIIHCFYCLATIQNMLPFPSFPLPWLHIFASFLVLLLSNVIRCGMKVQVNVTRTQSIFHEYKM